MNRKKPQYKFGSPGYKHGFTGTKIHVVWSHMIQRCTNPACHEYHNYGGRGIKVCSRWTVSTNFLKDMYPSYKEGLSLDRIDNDGDYSPENCRWVTSKEQNRNKRNNRVLSYKGETLCLVDWAHKLGMPANTLVYRLRRKWPVERLLTTPVNKPMIVNFKGKFGTISQHSKRTGLSYSKIYGYLYHKGML